MQLQPLMENYSLGNVAVFSTQHLLITVVSEPLCSCCETDVWVKIFHKLKLFSAALQSCLLSLFQNMQFNLDGVGACLCCFSPCF